VAVDLDRDPGPGAAESSGEDGWEPGAPSLRAMAPSVVGGALVPLAVYFLVRHHVKGDATALIIAGIPAAAFVFFELVRKRRIDPIGGAVLFGFVAGVIASYALGGNAFVLKVRDSLLTGLFGVACLASLRLRKPAMFYIGRSLSAGTDLSRIKAYNELWESTEAQRVFAVITAVWGFGLMLDAGVRVVLALQLRTAAFLATSPAVAALFFGSMFAFTVRYTRRARENSAEAVVEPTQAA
jgi:hypothetical protein